jgi:hypothetical protein
VKTGIADTRPRPRLFPKKSSLNVTTVAKRTWTHLGQLVFVRRNGYPDWPCIEVVRPELSPFPCKSDGMTLVLFLCDQTTYVCLASFPNKF